MMRALSFLAAVSLGLLAGCASAPAPAGAGADADLHVMSFNIRYGTAPDGDHAWEKRKPLVFGLIGERPYDLIGLQEALRFQIDEIMGTNAAFGEIGVGRDDGKSKGEHAAILYRKDRLTPDPIKQGTVWLSDTPSVPGSKHWGNGITRVFTFARFTDARTGSAFWMYNTHLDHQSEPARRRSAEAIAKHIESHAGRERVILTGDFNCSERSNAVRYLKGEIPRAWEDAANQAFAPSPQLIDTYRVKYPADRDVTTFQGFGKHVQPGVGVGEWGEKIDYILISSGAAAWQEVLDAAIDRRTFGDGPTKYPSDHWAVTATIR